MTLRFDISSITPTTGGGGGSANLTTLDVNPTTSAQSITPNTGYDGFSLVNVSGVNASIDANITASNIVNGVNILGVVGTASASAPKEVARYKIDENGLATANDKDVTGMFDSIVSVGDSAFDNCFYNIKIRGDVSFPNCNQITYYSFRNAFKQTNISSIRFPNEFNTVVYDRAFENVCSSSNVKSADFSGMRNAGLYTFLSAFNGCRFLTSINFNNLQNTNGQQSFERAFSYCYNLPSASFPSLSNVNGSNAFYFGFYNDSKLLTVSYPILNKVRGDSAFGLTFQYCSNLTDVDFSSLQSIDGNFAFQNAFANCGNLTNIDFSGLTVIGDISNYYTGVFRNAFANCSNLSNLTFDCLSKVAGSNLFNNFFGNVNNINIYFPLYHQYSSNKIFSNMLGGSSESTVHFSKTMENTMSSWADVLAGFGGTNATILFDLPRVSNSFSNFYNMTNNGEMGSNYFAVDASSESSNAWMALSQDNATGWHSAVSESPHYFTWYFPNGMYINSFRTTTSNAVNSITNSPKFINMCVSNDGTNWNEISLRISESISIYNGSYTWVYPHKAGLYKYHRVYFNSYQNDPSYIVTINQIYFNGAYRYNEE